VGLSREYRIKGLLLAAAMLLAPLAAGAQERERNPADPWEGVNRRIFIFNDYADRYLLRPVAKGYDRVTPDPLQQGITNVFNNLGEVSNLVNNLLQGKVVASANNGGRFLINSTVGILGIFDIAARWGMQPNDEDFGQTLGRWGVGPGPYLVVPLLGPRTLRDAFAGAAESYTDPVSQGVDHIPTRNQVTALRVVDLRAQLLAADELMTGDRYIFLRDAYLQRRHFLVNDGEIEDAFGDDDFDLWDE
jgi:phospholipid-binding lipoprotein MlaA